MEAKCQRSELLQSVASRFCIAPGPIHWFAASAGFRCTSWLFHQYAQYQTFRRMCSRSAKFANTSCRESALRSLLVSCQGHDRLFSTEAHTHPVRWASALSTTVGRILPTTKGPAGLVWFRSRRVLRYDAAGLVVVGVAALLCHGHVLFLFCVVGLFLHTHFATPSPFAPCRSARPISPQGSYDTNHHTQTLYIKLSHHHSAIIPSMKNTACSSFGQRPLPDIL